MKKYLTETERSSILELRKSNASLQTIAKSIHRSSRTIAKFLKNPPEYVKEMEAYSAMTPGDKPINLSMPKPKFLERKKKIKFVASIRKFLSKEEREKVLSQRSEGKTITAIAQNLGRGGRTIKMFLSNQDQYEQLINNTLEENQKQSVQSNSIIKQVIGPKALSKGNQLKVLEMKQKGMTVKQIAAEMRKSLITIESFLQNENNYEEFMSKVKTSTPTKQWSSEQFNGSGPNNNSVLGRPNGKRYLTEEERNAIMQLLKENMSKTSIAKRIHRGRVTVNEFLTDPDKYTQEAQMFKELKVNRKQPNHSYKVMNQEISEENLKCFKKVSIEHRSVIKFLVKKGNTPKLVFEDMKKVYGKSTPEFVSIYYWVQQFQNGRQTIVNDKPAKSSQPEHLAAGIENLDNTKDGLIESSSKSGGGDSKKTAPVKLKLFQFKFKPVKRLKEEN